jgi:transcription antitermination factor NusG
MAARQNSNPDHKDDPDARGTEKPSDGSTPPSSLRWYVIRTLPRLEASAERNLLQQGFHTFFPRLITTRRHARKFYTKTEMLFPRYAFVMLDLQKDRWRSINGTIGVEALLTAKDAPIPVPIDVMDDLLAAADSSGIVDLSRSFVAGDTVELISGPLIGAMGTLVRLNDNGRAELLLKMINGSVRLRVALDTLKPAAHTKES